MRGYKTTIRHQATLPAPPCLGQAGCWSSDLGDFPLRVVLVSWSAQQVELPANLLAPGHAVDHDVGQRVPPFSPASQAVAVESDAMKPLQSLLGVLAL